MNSENGRSRGNARKCPGSEYLRIEAGERTPQKRGKQAGLTYVSGHFGFNHVYVFIEAFI